MFSLMTSGYEIIR